MAKRPTRCVPSESYPPPAIIPKQEFFEAELCGSDADNYIYIRSTDPSNVQNYFNIRSLLEKENEKGVSKSFPESEMSPGRLAVLKEEYFFHRVKLIRKDEIGMVHCVKIDDGNSATARARQIFTITKQDLSIPINTIKCRLDGLGFFNELPHLEMAYRLINMSQIDDRSFFRVQVLHIENGIPLVKMTKKGFNLSNQVQKFIQQLCEFPVPKSGCPLKAELTFANYKACIWFRSWDENKLFYKIQAALRQYHISYSSFVLKNFFSDCSISELFQKLPVLPDQEPVPVSPEDIWKQKYFTFPSGIFLFENKNDREFYRVKVTRVINKEKIEVEFIDFGTKCLTNRKSLVPVKEIDENLGLIPPQCVKARLHGSYCIDLNQFWSLIPYPENVRIVVKDQQGSDNGLEVEIFPTESQSDSFGQTGTTGSPLKLLNHDLKPILANSEYLREKRYWGSPRIFLTQG